MISIYKNTNHMNRVSIIARTAEKFITNLDIQIQLIFNIIIREWSLILLLTKYWLKAKLFVALRSEREWENGGKGKNSAHCAECWQLLNNYSIPCSAS